MSYILDALKKSELERKRGAVPDLSTPPADIAVPTRSVPPVLFGFVAVVLLGGGIVLGWMRPWAHPEPAAETKAEPKLNAASAPRESTPPEAARHTPAGVDQTTLALARTPPEQKPQAAPQASEPPAEASTPPRVPAKAEPREPSRSVARRPVDTRPLPNNRPTAPAAPAQVASAVVQPQDSPAPAEASVQAVTAKPPDRVVSFSELPASVRRDIPRLAISGYAHAAAPDSRMAVINERVVLEGEELSAGLKLEHVGSDGVVLNYKGYRFYPGP